MPNCIRVIRKNSLNWGVFMHKLIIPASVEVFEDHEYSLDGSIKVLEFEEGSKLKSFGFNALKNLDRLKVNNEYFVTKENGAVMPLNPRGIVFVPKNLKKLKIDKKLKSYIHMHSQNQTLRRSSYINH